MENLSREEYCDRVSKMDRNKLIRECIKLYKKLRKLSGICDVDDVRDALNENTELAIRLQQKEYQLEKSKEMIITELRGLGRKPATGSTLQSLTKFLIKTLKEQ